MSKVIKTKVYEYDELSDKAKETACDWYRRVRDSDEWWESTFDDAERAGLKIKGFDIDHGTIKGDFLTDAADCAESIRDEHGEMCETHKTAEKFLKAIEEETKQFNNLVDETTNQSNATYEQEKAFTETISEMEEGFLHDILEDYLISLSKEYEYQQSEEVVSENIRENEYTFTKEGERFG